MDRRNGLRRQQSAGVIEIRTIASEYSADRTFPDGLQQSQASAQSECPGGWRIRIRQDPISTPNLT